MVNLSVENFDKVDYRITMIRKSSITVPPDVNNWFWGGSWGALFGFEFEEGWTHSYGKGWGVTP